VGTQPSASLLCTTKGSMIVGTDGARQFSHTHMLMADAAGGFVISNECFRFV
jgi:hypothetical protein